ncbi:MAG: 30S ribosomal protein S3, partial [Nanoarchaeota archaeon]|nr:30S ribosomal protein S3 [Nanoarchaeota archaeon]
MIERKFIESNMRELLVMDFMSKQLGKGKYSKIIIKKTPLGEKIIVYTSRPGLVVGKKGENIKRLTQQLKSKFKMENPQMEVAEIDSPFLDAQNMAEQIVSTMERFGPKRFKATGYRALQRIMDAGAMGAEIVISGRGVPSSRAKSWRFYAGYLKKSGDISMNYVIKGQSIANLRSGSIGIKVKILLPDTKLPDKIEIIKVEEPSIKIEEVNEEEKPSSKELKKKTSKTDEKKEAKEVKEEVKEEKEEAKEVKKVKKVKKVKGEKKELKKKTSKTEE